VNPLVSELATELERTWTNLEPAEAEPRPAHRAPNGPNHPAHRTHAALLNDDRHRLLNDDGLPHNGNALLDHDGAGADKAAAEPSGLSRRGCG
jgi:hypothetical protein